MQSAVSNWGFRERAGYLCKSQTLDRRSEECSVVVRDELVQLGVGVLALM